MWTISIGLLAVVAAFFLRMKIERANLKERSYRIGWELDPPFQMAGSDGQPTGLAVELIREAAKRSGIKLQWSQESSSSEAALRDGKVE